MTEHRPGTADERLRPWLLASPWTESEDFEWPFEDAGDIKTKAKCLLVNIASPRRRETIEAMIHTILSNGPRIVVVGGVETVDAEGVTKGHNRTEVSSKRAPLVLSHFGELDLGNEQKAQPARSALVGSAGSITSVLWLVREETSNPTFNDAVAERAEELSEALFEALAAARSANESEDRASNALEEAAKEEADDFASLDHRFDQLAKCARDLEATSSTAAKTLEELLGSLSRRHAGAGLWTSELQSAREAERRRDRTRGRLDAELNYVAIAFTRLTTKTDLRIARLGFWFATVIGIAALAPPLVELLTA